MKRRDFIKLSAGLGATMATTTPLSPAFAQTKTVLKAADVHPLGYPTVEAVLAMGKKLETGTNGRLSIQMFPSMQLGGEKEMIEQAQLGALQIARISVGAVGPVVDDALAEGSSTDLVTYVRWEPVPPPEIPLPADVFVPHPERPGERHTSPRSSCRAAARRDRSAAAENRRDVSAR